MKENLEPVCLKGTTFRLDEKGNGEVEDTGVTNETGAHQVWLKGSPSLSLGEYDDDDGGGDGLSDEGPPTCL